MGMECARWEDEYMMQGRVGLGSSISLYRTMPVDTTPAANALPTVVTYSGCTRSPVHSLLCPKLAKQVLLPHGAT